MTAPDPAAMFAPGAWVHPDETDEEDRDWDDDAGHFIRR